MGQKAKVKDPPNWAASLTHWGALDAHGNQAPTSGIADSVYGGDVWGLVFLRALQTDRMCSQE